MGSSASSTLRAVGHRPGDGHALLLAAGELRRPVLDALAQPERFSRRLARALGFARGCRPAIICGSIDILQRRELRQQMMELIDEADLVAADAGALGVAAA